MGNVGTASTPENFVKQRGKKKYPQLARGVYALFLPEDDKIEKPHDMPLADIVFIHGLRGSAFKSWRKLALPDSKSGRKRGEVRTAIPATESGGKERDVSNGQTALIVPEIRALSHVRTSPRRKGKTGADSSEMPASSILSAGVTESDAARISQAIQDELSRQRSDEKRHLSRISPGESEYVQWPEEFLGVDFPHCRVIAIDYPAFLMSDLGRGRRKQTKKKRHGKKDSVGTLEQGPALGTATPGEKKLEIPAEKKMKESQSDGQAPDLDPPMADEDITLENLSDYVLEQLKSAGVGREKRPVVFVTHSLGGLIAKRILLKDSQLLRSTKGLAFYGVPHSGSPLKVAPWLRPLMSKVSKQLLEGDEDLLKLKKQFEDLARQKEICCISIVESKPIKIAGNLFRRNQLVVPKRSAELEVGETFEVRGADHSEVCKATAKEGDVRYDALKNFLKSVLKSADTQIDASADPG